MVFMLNIGRRDARTERADGLIGTPGGGMFVWKQDGVFVPDTTVSSRANEDHTALNSVTLTVAQGMPVTTRPSVTLLNALLARSGLSLSRKP